MKKSFIALIAALALCAFTSLAADAPHSPPGIHAAVGVHVADTMSVDTTTTMAAPLALAETILGSRATIVQTESIADLALTNTANETANLNDAYVTDSTAKQVDANRPRAVRRVWRV